MKVIAVDFDGTASSFPGKVRELHSVEENLIVIHTARPEFMREQTVDELHKLKIPYHSLVMDKLKADVYIDDRNAGGLQWP